MKAKTDDYMDNEPIHVEGAHTLVTWFIQEGTAQIHVAEADIAALQFDMLIIPVDCSLKGYDVRQPDTRCNYKAILPDPNDEFVFGDVIWCTEGSGFESKRVALAVISGQALENICFEKAIHSMLTEMNRLKANEMTTGILINKGYDIARFCQFWIEHRDTLDTKKCALFLCTHPADDRVADTVLLVNDLINTKMKLTRRMVSPKLEGIFPRMKVETTILPSPILGTGCEVVIAAVGPDFDLGKGGISKALSDEAGKECVDSFASHQGEHMYWKAILCQSGKLVSRGIYNVIFGCLPKWERNISQVVFVNPIVCH